jgi:transcriptional regulator with PAS, ATPase and Fis domain
VTTHDQRRLSSLPPRFHVIVVSGPDQGASVPIDGEVLVGTSEACDLRLNDRAASRRHLLIRPGRIGVRVVDQESRNGTWQGEHLIYEAELAVGGELRLGATVLRFEIEPCEEGEKPVPSNPARHGFGRFLGAAPCLGPVYDRVQRVAPTDSTVLLEGESGTGKELLAEAIHDGSQRASGPFVVLDCGAMPDTLIEARLFGHERGAFTGAERAQPGAFEAAAGGTVFLDEVGELPPSVQTRLLRVVDRRQVCRLGSQKTIDVDVRVIAATHRNLEREVEESRFRLDLFHRLAVVLIRLPPLRERPEDIEPLAREFLRLYGGADGLLTNEVLTRMREHRWPGNARELRNHVERLVVLGEAEALSRDGGGGAGDPPPETIPYRRARALAVERFTTTYVEEVLARHAGNVSAAARAAGVSRRYFQRLSQRA